jgi:hypothetical protein
MQMSVHDAGWFCNGRLLFRKEDAVIAFPSCADGAVDEARGDGAWRTLLLGSNVVYDERHAREGERVNVDYTEMLVPVADYGRWVFYLRAHMWALEGDAVMVERFTRWEREV